MQGDGGFLTHRLLKRTQAGWIAKGDHYRILDPVQSVEAIAGRAIAIERGGKRIDFDTPFWRLTGRLLGRLGWWEARAFGWLRSYGRLEQRARPLRCGRPAGGR
jgi:hypothetical protein